MKRLTLDRAFDLCMEQWADCVAAIKSGDYTFSKAQWTRRHGYTRVEYDCFFCEYAKQNDGLMDGPYKKDCHGCSECPGRLISPTFHCERHVSYKWDNKPLKFYAKLLELNRKRKATQ